ncbi:MAG: IGHMBP2 family helicase [bacterium JZ-2024 1]
MSPIEGAEIVSASEYLAELARLVDLERRATMEFHLQEITRMSGRERESKGRALLNMFPRFVGRGLGDRYLVRFHRSGRRLPETEIAAGDIVLVTPVDARPDPRRDLQGTVAQITPSSITVMFDYRVKFPPSRQGWRLDLYSNEVTFQRMEDAINYLRKGHGIAHRVKSLLFGWDDLEFDGTGLEDIRWVNPRLNDSQKQAVISALSARDLYLIHGPPGTGKTTTCVELIAQMVRLGQKVLACADSNTAIDNMVEGLLEVPGLRIVRMGHPARVMPRLLETTLDFQVESHPRYVVVKQFRDEAQQWREEQSRYIAPTLGKRRGYSDTQILRMARRGRASRGWSVDEVQKMARWIEIQHEVVRPLLDKARKIEEELIFVTLANAQVVCATNATVGSEVLSGWTFDAVVIDEATQATEPSCIIPLIRGKKYVLAGDHKQLPPTVVSQEALARGLGKSLFERLLEIYPVDEVSSLLAVQYRMNESLMRFPSRYFYGGRIVADASAKTRKLSDLLRGHAAPRSRGLDFPIPDAITDAVLSDTALVFVDTAGSCPERQKPGSLSRDNPGEAYLALAIVQRLLGSALKPEHIGIIAPYRDMVERLRMLRESPDLEIHTVDGFQGREKEVIILTLVRSNRDRYVGFLEDLRRLNVSITRARRKLIVIGDRETVAADAMYAQWLDSIGRYGKLINLAELGFTPPQDTHLNTLRSHESGDQTAPSADTPESTEA